MTCAECRPLLEAHLDRELDPRSSLEVEEHLRTCASCRAAFDGLLSLQTLVRDRAPRYEVSARLERRLRGRALPRFVAPAAALAACALLALLLLPRGPGPIEEALADAHVRALEPGHALDVVSSDQHTVVPFFAGKLPFAVPARDFTAQGFPLLGGRIDVIGGQRVAALAYGHGRHQVSAFLWPEEGKDEAPRPARAIRGYRPVTWRSGGLRFWLISDAGVPELQSLAGLLSGG
jgi:anti-sigma factor RsiW